MLSSIAGRRRGRIAIEVSVRTPPVSGGPRVRAYSATLEQPVHRHDQPEISLVLAGGFLEESQCGEAVARPCMFTVRPSGFSHRVRYGARGALVLSGVITADSFKMACSNRINRWRSAPELLVKHVLACALTGAPVADLDDALWDAIGLASDGEPAEEPTTWLRQSRDRLIEEPVSIAELASECGVHRVHFSRAFTRAFGIPPSVYRNRMQAFRAASAAIGGKGGVESAYVCGFADQSHMARVVRAATDSSFTQLRQLAGQVTSVQA